MSSAASVVLNALKGGIERRKRKGGADPSTLWDLVNGFVNEKGIPESRPGTAEDATLPTGSKGLLAFGGELMVFAIAAIEVPAGYTCEIINHPTSPSEPLERIHFAAGVYGFPYVIAEYDNGDIFHYWLQTRDAWTADTVYTEGDLVEPTEPNGYVYRAHRNTETAFPVWAADVARAEGDCIEPTTPNGFYYECTDTLGASPRSGATEPTWPESEGAVVYEDTDVTQPPRPVLGGGDGLGPDIGIPGGTEDRYDNWGGGGRLSDMLSEVNRS